MAEVGGVRVKEGEKFEGEGGVGSGLNVSRAKSCVEELSAAYKSMMQNVNHCRRCSSRKRTCFRPYPSIITLTSDATFNSAGRGETSNVDPVPHYMLHF